MLGILYNNLVTEVRVPHRNTHTHKILLRANHHKINACPHSCMKVLLFIMKCASFDIYWSIKQKLFLGLCSSLAALDVDRDSEGR